MNNLKQHHLTPFLPDDFEALLSALNQIAIVSITDHLGNITYANDKFVEVAQYSREELIGQNHRILKSGGQSQTMFDDLWKTIVSGKVWRGEIKNRSKDGSYYWVDTCIAPILNALGVPERYIAVRFLITQKKLVEENMKKQNTELQETKKATLNILEDVSEEKGKYQKQLVETKKFSMAVEGANEHIIITDSDGIILYANPAVEKTTGYSAQEILGTKAGKRWGGLMDHQFYVNLWRTIKTDKKSFSGELKNHRKNGDEYTAFAIISPILDQNNDVEFFVAIERDITKEKQIDQAKSEFVSLASHQLRTPLSAINWYTEMILGGDAGKITPKQKKYLEEIYTGNQRMVELVNSLLNVSRLELGTFVIEPTPTDVKKLIESVVGEQEQQIEKKQIILSATFEKDIPIMQVDPKLLRMLVQNLLSNAVKYTPDKGTIAVSLTLSDPKTILLKVSDTGYGIPKSQEDKIFTKLFRADNVREMDTEGTGLGLYIVKSIIDQSGGSVRFESKENEGTTFFVTLPVAGMKKKEGTKTLA